VAAGFLPLHHRGKNLLGRKIRGRLVEQRIRVGGENARDEARAHLRAAGVAAGGIEREADHRPPVALHVGDHRDDRGGHLGEIEARVAQIRAQRNGFLSDIDDAHGFPHKRIANSE
jgi:hypothetical protein